MAVRNVKRQDFDYYLTNLDWDDGTPIDRDIHQFTRNDVFDHTYEKPGFYSVKGLVFKFERVMIDITPIRTDGLTPVSNIGANQFAYWEEITADVFESASSRIFDQAENRLHVQQALLASLLGGL